MYEYIPIYGLMVTDFAIFLFPRKPIGKPQRAWTVGQVASQADAGDLDPPEFGPKGDDDARGHHWGVNDGEKIGLFHHDLFCSLMDDG